MNEDEEAVLKSMAEGVTKGLSDSKIVNNLLEPVSKEVGKTLGTISKAINVAISPIAGMIWGYEKISTWLMSRLEQKLNNVPIENIIPPKALIVGPSIEAIKFLGEDEELREMFAQLIASSLNKEEAVHVHPGFVEILKNLSTEDAKVLNFIYLKGYCPEIKILAWAADKPNVEVPVKYLFSILEEIENLLLGGHTSIVNLERLGLIESAHLSKVDRTDYNKIRSSVPYSEIINNGIEINKPYKVLENYFELTSLGKDFCRVCIGKMIEDFI
ncbi:MAG: DUF4393 domain-containing protein [Mucilaginibacter sp.]